MKSQKRFIILVLSILAMSFLLDKVVYFALSKIDQRTMTGENIGKLNHFLSLKDTIQTVILGNSRACHHMNPEYFASSTYNMGINGRDLAYIHAMVKTLPANKPQRVIINLDPVKIYDPEYDGSDIKILSNKYHQNKVLRAALAESGNMSFLQDFYWCLDYNNKVLSLLGNLVTTKRDHTKYDGFDPIRVTKRQQQLRDDRHAERLLEFAEKEQNCETEFIPNPLALRHLKGLVSYCKANQKELLIISTPMWIDYCKDDNIALSKLLLEMNVEYTDHTNYFDNDPDPENWRDNTHLSEKGANIFTEFLVTQLK